MALEKFRFGRTQNGETFAVEKHGPNIALMLKGSGDALRARIAKAYRKLHGKPPSASALTDALNTLEGEALDAEMEAVHLRVATHDQGIVVDLGDKDGRAVLVTPGEVKVVERSPVLFRRTALTAPLPVPEFGGKPDELREILNVNDDSWPLIFGWLVAVFLPDVPHPILLLSGLQGTGKSSAARLLISLFDPSTAPLRSEPRDPEQWAVAASGSYGVGIDNLSRISVSMSDAYCKAVTGDAFVKRKLYTDGDLAVLAFRRVILLTSIDPALCAAT